MLRITALAKKCDCLQDYNTQFEGQMTPLQTQVAKLQKKLGSSFKSFTILKKKYNDLNVTLSSIHSKLRQETSHHASEVEKFKFIVGGLKEDPARVQRELEVTSETTVVENKEFEAFKDDLADGSEEAIEIVFTCLLNRLARDHPAMELSFYNFTGILKPPAL